MGASTSKAEFGTAMLDRIVDKSAYEGLVKDYDYENLAFEGGGAKGIAYTGAVKVSCNNKNRTTHRQKFEMGVHFSIDSW
jgi:hypothetical protein